MIRVNSKQKGNNVLNYIKKSIWHFEESLNTDYEVNGSINMVFLSIRFHVCKPEYIHKKIKKIGKKYQNNILLIYIDTKNYEAIASEIFTISDLYNYTCLFGFSDEECSTIISAFDTKNTNFEILRKKESDPLLKFLSSFPRVNTTDVESLKANLGSLKDITTIKIKNVAGMGETKADLIHEYLNKKFK